MASAENKYTQSLNKRNYFLDKSLSFAPSRVRPSGGQGLLFSSVLLDLSNTNISFKERLRLILHKNKLESLAQRLENCKETGWFNLFCKDCDKLIHRARLSCMAPYCYNPECIRNRKRYYQKLLNKLGIKTKQMLHFVIGFPFVKRFTKKKRLKHQKVIRLFIKEMKRLGSPLMMIDVRDLNKRKNKLYVHYHCANIPHLKFDYRKYGNNLVRARENIIKKTNIQFTIKSKGFRSKTNIYRYFVNRLAGIFGDVKAKRYYGYKDMMDLKTYLYDFYGTTRITINKDLKELLKKFRASAEAHILQCMLDEDLKICPFCKSKNLSFFIINQNNPPPNCKSCGLPVQMKKGCSIVACEMCERAEGNYRNQTKFQILDEKIKRRFEIYCNALDKKPIKLTFPERIDLTIRDFPNEKEIETIKIFPA